MEDCDAGGVCKKELKHENLNRAIADLMGLESEIKQLRTRITTPNDTVEKMVCETQPAICIEKPLAATLAEAPNQIHEVIKKINDHLNAIKLALF